MKEKRVLAMFITSVVTLVASLAVTFGVLTTLADPVEATGVVRYAFTFNEQNALITSEGNKLKIKESIVFKPSDELCWNEFENKNDESTDEPIVPILVNSTDYQGSIMYFDETVSSRVKMIPFRISNKTEKTMNNVKIDVVYDKTTTIGKYTKVMIYDYAESRFVEQSTLTIPSLDVNDYRDFIVVVYVDQTGNLSSNRVNFETDYETINIEVTDQSLRTED